jgi:hypothetical protein
MKGLKFTDLQLHLNRTQVSNVRKNRLYVWDSFQQHVHVKLWHAENALLNAIYYFHYTFAALKIVDVSNSKAEHSATWTSVSWIMTTVAEPFNIVFPV